MDDLALSLAVPFIAEREGFVAEPYQDSGGVWTYGYGATTTQDGERVGSDTPPISQEDAYARLQAAVVAVLTRVRPMVYVPVTDHAIAALTSFAYNVGTGALRISMLLQALNTGQPMHVVAQQFAAWVYVGHHRSQGLVNRRALEAKLFLAS